MRDRMTEANSKLCPCCGAHLSTTLKVGETRRTAEPGDLAACPGCVAPLRYTTGIFLERVQLNELNIVQRAALMATQRQLWKERGK